MKLIFLYLILINLYSFFLYYIDKRKAVTRSSRVPENTLLLVAAIGGSIGGYLSMRLFHHKTKHTKFSLGLPLFIVIQILTISFLLQLFK